MVTIEEIAKEQAKEEQAQSFLPEDKPISTLEGIEFDKPELVQIAEQEKRKKSRRPSTERKRFERPPVPAPTPPKQLGPTIEAAMAAKEAAQTIPSTQESQVLSQKIQGEIRPTIGPAEPSILPTKVKGAIGEFTESFKEGFFFEPTAEQRVRGGTTAETLGFIAGSSVSFASIPLSEGAGALSRLGLLKVPGGAKALQLTEAALKTKTGQTVLLTAAGLELLDIIRQDEPERLAGVARGVGFFSGVLKPLPTELKTDIKGQITGFQETNVIRSRGTFKGETFQETTVVRPEGSATNIKLGNKNILIEQSGGQTRFKVLNKNFEVVDQGFFESSSPKNVKITQGSPEQEIISLVEDRAAGLTDITFKERLKSSGTLNEIIPGSKLTKETVLSVETKVDAGGIITAQKQIKRSGVVAGLEVLETKQTIVGGDIIQDLEMGELGPRKKLVEPGVIDIPKTTKDLATLAETDIFVRKGFEVKPIIVSGTDEIKFVAPEIVFGEGKSPDDILDFGVVKPGVIEQNIIIQPRQILGGLQRQSTLGQIRITDIPKEKLKTRVSKADLESAKRIESLIEGPEITRVAKEQTQRVETLEAVESELSKKLDTVTPREQVDKRLRTETGELVNPELVDPFIETPQTQIGSRITTEPISIPKTTEILGQIPGTERVEVIGGLFDPRLSKTPSKEPGPIEIISTDLGIEPIIIDTAEPELPKEIIVPISDTQPVQSIIPITAQKPDTKRKQRGRQEPIQEIEPIVIQEPAQAQIPETAQEQISITAQKQVPIQSQGPPVFLGSFVPLSAPIPVKGPKIPLTGFSKGKDLFSFQVGDPSLETFRTGTGKSILDVLRKGGQQVESTPARSLRIFKGEKEIKLEEESIEEVFGGRFRKGKKGQIVEKETFAISTPGELIGITEKGQRASRSKNKKKFSLF